LLSTGSSVWSLITSACSAYFSKIEAAVGKIGMLLLVSVLVRLILIHLSTSISYN